MKKALILIIVAALLFSTAGCGDSYERDSDSPRKTRTTTSTTKYITLDEWYAGVDLSQFSRHGNSTENTAMWVEKSDYTGTQYGCINTKGEWVVPLTSDIESVSNFDFSDAGLSIVIWNGSQRAAFGGIAEKYSDDFGVIYNMQGEVMEKFELKGVLSEWTHLNNGNIYLTQVYPFGTGNECCLMYCVSTNQFVEVSNTAWQSLYKIKYSDGLMLVYSNSYDTAGARYYDENGNCCIDLENSNEYYRTVHYADHFVDGQANVDFTGMDGRRYTVKINKRGEWITEPEVTYEDRNFSTIF